MPELQQSLVDRLSQVRVRIEVPDPDKCVLRGVPTNQEFFNKGSTNLLVARQGCGRRFLAFVDQDLVYAGQDDELLRAFEGPIDSGWRAIFMGERSHDLQAVVERALAVLGFDGHAPVPPRASRSSESDTGPLLARFATDITGLAEEGTLSPTAGRIDETEAVVSSLMKWGQTRLPLIVGESGVGKTNLIHASARRLHEHRPELRLMLVELAELFAGCLFPPDRDSLLQELLTEAATPGIILGLEHLDLIEGGQGPLLLSRHLDAGGKVIGTVLTGWASQLSCGPFGRRLEVIALREPTVTETIEVLRALREPIMAHHGVDVDDSCLQMCVRASEPLGGVFPAKAIDLLDASCSRAALTGSTVIGPDDIFSIAGRRQRLA